MVKYCLTNDEFLQLKNDYGVGVLHFAYPLRVLKICIDEAVDAYGELRGFESFVDWLGELSQNVEEGFEYIERYTEAADDGNENVDNQNANSVFHCEHRRLFDLCDSIKEVAEGLASALDSCESGSAPADIDEEDEELFEVIADAVVEKVVAIGWETYHCLVGADTYSEDPQQGTCEEVKGLFSDGAIRIAALLSKQVARPFNKTQTPARYRAARGDARVGTIKRKIEEAFGLPSGSIVLIGPDGKSVRADALISTLRRRWARHSNEE